MICYVSQGDKLKFFDGPILERACGNGSKTLSKVESWSRHRNFVYWILSKKAHFYKFSPYSQNREFECSKILWKSAWLFESKRKCIPITWFLFGSKRLAFYIMRHFPWTSITVNIIVYTYITDEDMYSKICCFFHLT